MILKWALEQVYNLPEENISILMDNMEIMSFSKGEIIVKEGQRDFYIYFVEKGLVRNYILREGKCVTLGLTSEGNMVICTPGLSETVISGFEIDALEDCIIYRISRDTLGHLFRENIVFSEWGRRLLEKLLIDNEYYYREFYWADKKIQYQILLKKHPDLLQRVPLNEIASWLNITPQSLSRIRANFD